MDLFEYMSMQRKKEESPLAVRILMRLQGSSIL